jgi:hypothetical protein
MGLDDGDELHGSATLGAAKGVGVVDLLDEHGPSSSVQRGGFCGRNSGDTRHNCRENSEFG